MVETGILKANEDSSCSVYCMELLIRAYFRDCILSCKSPAWAYCVSGALCKYPVLGKCIGPQSIRLAATCPALVCEGVAHIRGNQSIAVLFY